MSAVRGGPGSGGARRLEDLLARSAQRFADRPALVGDDETLSYAELDRLVDRLAHALLAHGLQPGDRVGVLAEKTPTTIAALIATLRAGGIYVPLDAASPAARAARIVRSADPSVVLVGDTAAPLLDAVLTADPELDVVVGGLDGPVGGERFASRFSPADLPTTDVTGLARPDTELAHLLFTSGSTGLPKGVMITHEMVLEFVEWATGHFGTAPEDRISGHPPLHFDLSTFDIYATLAAGAALHLVPSSLGVDPRGTAAFIRDRCLTQWFSVPTVLTYLARFDAIGDGDFPELRRLLWCGEVLPTPVLAHWMRRLPHVRFTNLYGPTEATIASSFHDVTEVPADETVPVPIGRACTGEELVVLDDDGAPAPAGELGELCIGGVGLSPGYWRDTEKTAAAFRVDPRHPAATLYRTGDLARIDAEGVAHFRGRADSQIKSRGYRIELGEIESAVDTVAGIRECAVVGVDTGGFEGTTICCAYSTTDAAGDLASGAVRSAIAALVPPYMLPSRWMVMPDLPKNVNGKIDRPALRERFAETGRSPSPVLEGSQRRER